MQHESQQHELQVVLPGVLLTATQPQCLPGAPLLVHSQLQLNPSLSTSPSRLSKHATLRRSRQHWLPHHCRHRFTARRCPPATTTAAHPAAPEPQLVHEAQQGHGSDEDLAQHLSKRIHRPQQAILVRGGGRGAAAHVPAASGVQQGVQPGLAAGHRRQQHPEAG